MSFCKRVLCGKVVILIASALFIITLITAHIHPSRPTTNDIENMIQKICKPKPTVISSESHQASHLYGHNQSLLMTDHNLREDVWDHVKVKGAFYMMTRNEDLFKAKATVKSIEERFNGRANVTYPWIFLNNQKFSPEFKKYMRRIVSRPDQVYFGQVDLEAWNYPSWIDSVRSQTLFSNFRELEYQKIRRPTYGNYLRYQSGLFFHHPLFNDVDYVWRVNAGSHYNCEMFRNDPFVAMQEKNKTIGFSLTERSTSEMSLFSLWPVTNHFATIYPHLVEPAANSIYSWLVDSRDEYNMCQISTSFEIVSMAFLKSEQYRTFFYYLDLVGGFFYERWTDAAVRTIASALFLKRQDLYFFNDVAFTYKDTSHCPLNFTLLKNCACDYKDSFDYRRSSCTLDLLHIIQPKLIDEMVSFAKVVTSQYDK
ncbi:unnamed protein product [Rhizopus stolonifer]